MKTISLPRVLACAVAAVVPAIAAGQVSGPVFTMTRGAEQIDGRLNTNNRGDGLHFGDAATQLVSDWKLESISSLTIAKDRYGATAGLCCDNQKVTLVIREGNRESTYAGCLVTNAVSFDTQSRSIQLNSGNNAEIKIVRKK